MITPQLIDFIKQSLQQGATKEKITADLVSNGWALVDIEQGFNSLITPPIINPSPVASPVSTTISEPTVIITEENHSNKTPIILTVVTLLVLAFGASGYYFRNDLPIVKDLIKSDTSTVGELSQDQTDQAILEQPQQPETPVVTETTPTQDSSIKTEDAPTPTVTPVGASKVATTKTEPIDCGKDMTCFMNAIKTCSSVVVEQSQALNLFGMFTQTNKAKITLTGFNSSKKCGYTSQVLDATVGYSTETMASSNYKNATDEEKKQGLAMLTQFNDSAKSTIGITTKCSFTTTYLTGLYTKWAKGEYSSKDLDPDNCEYSGGDKSIYTTKIGLYYNKGSSSMSNSGYEFKLISINENQIELNITKELTKETKNITLVPKQEVKLFEATFSLQEIKKDDIGLLALIGILKDNAKLNTF